LNEATITSPRIDCLIAGNAIVDLTAAARPTGPTSFGALIQIKPCKRRLRHCCLLPPTPRGRFTFR